MTEMEVAGIEIGVDGIIDEFAEHLNSFAQAETWSSIKTILN